MEIIDISFGIGNNAWGDERNFGAGAEAIGQMNNTQNTTEWENQDQNTQQNNWDADRQQDGPPGGDFQQDNGANWDSSGPSNGQTAVENGNWNNVDNPEDSGYQSNFAAASKSQSINRSRRPLRGPKGVWYGPSHAGQPEAEDEPAYDVPEEIANNIESKYQVRAGKGYMYSHSTRRPLYLDTLDDPYAVFTFKYLDRGRRLDNARNTLTNGILEVLERVLNVKVETETAGYLEPLQPEEQQAKLEALSKDDLIRMIMTQQV